MQKSVSPTASQAVSSRFIAYEQAFSWGLLCPDVSFAADAHFARNAVNLDLPFEGFWFGIEIRERRRMI